MFQINTCLLDEYGNYKVNLFESFPREIGIQKRWCETFAEYNQYIKNANGRTDCYCSVYRQTIRMNLKRNGDANPAGAVLDKVFLDFDTRFGYESMIIAHEILDEQDIVHRVNISGRWDEEKVISYLDEDSGKFKFMQIKVPSTIGFHVYFWIYPNARHKKDVLGNFHKDICDKISKKLYNGWGVETIKDKWIVKDGKNYRIPEWELPIDQIYAPVDRRIWGDVMRISRIPNTWNIKRKRFCIPLDEYMINNYNSEELNEISKKQNFIEKDKMYIGQKLMKIPKKFDIKSSYAIYDNYKPSPDLNPDPKVLKGMLLPICIKKWLTDSTLDFNRRFWLITYLRDTGVSMEETYKILESFLVPEYSHHCIYVEMQPWRAYQGNARKWQTPNCFKMSALCSCRDECPNCHRYRYRHPVF